MEGFIPELIWLSAASKFAPNEQWAEGARQVRAVLAVRRERGILPQERVIPFDRHQAASEEAE